MITSEFDSDTAQGRIVLRPNRSWTWRANIMFVGTLMGVSGTVATVFAYRGAWLVLPFTFIEMSVLLASLYYCVRRTHLQEVLTFSADQLLVERGIGGPQTRLRFDRYFARFLVRRADHPWYRKRVAVRCRGRETEIGAFLSSDEKDRLVDELRAMIAHLDQPRGWARQ